MATAVPTGPCGGPCAIAAAAASKHPENRQTTRVIYGLLVSTARSWSYNRSIMSKFLTTAAVALGAVMLSGSLALAQAPAPGPKPDAGKTPTVTQTTKKGKKKAGAKKTGKKKGTKRPAATTPPQ